MNDYLKTISEEIIESPLLISDILKLVSLLYNVSSVKFDVISSRFWHKKHTFEKKLQ